VTPGGGKGGEDGKRKKNQEPSAVKEDGKRLGRNPIGGVKAKSFVGAVRSLLGWDVGLRLGTGCPLKNGASGGTDENGSE